MKYPKEGSFLICEICKEPCWSIVDDISMCWDCRNESTTDMAFCNLDNDISVDQSIRKIHEKTQSHS